jgi:hypothetical protein
LISNRFGFLEEDELASPAVTIVTSVSIWAWVLESERESFWFVLFFSLVKAKERNWGRNEENQKGA